MVVRGKKWGLWITLSWHGGGRWRRHPYFRFSPITRSLTLRFGLSRIRERLVGTPRCAASTLLLTGSKFWDTRSNKGGGGAVDMAMHLIGLNFKQAVRFLKELDL